MKHEPAFTAPEIFLQTMFVFCLACWGVGAPGWVAIAGIVSQLLAISFILRRKLRKSTAPPAGPATPLDAG
jgi:hypothetical protein